MSDLYLIAHKVRGEPAFDVATRIQCPECSIEDVKACTECDCTGFWWIIPTSGHRAYPIIHWPLDMLVHYTGDNWHPSVMDEAGPLISHPSFVSTTDHYTTHHDPAKPSINITALIPKSPPIRRRV